MNILRSKSHNEIYPFLGLLLVNLEMEYSLKWPRC